MMGTGEAEGEKRAEEATNAALNNPLIDEYSLKGAKGLLVNITGGTDLTLFEVDEAVNKIRAEVDPEAELIFGSIEDENLNGKIRVSIVATSLDGQSPQIKPIISMIHRMQNRNMGYTESSVNTIINNQSALKATEGATALDMNSALEQSAEIQKTPEPEHINENEKELENISMESAAYLQNIENEPTNDNSPLSEEISSFEVDGIELTTPELFSNTGDDEVFNQDISSEEGPKAFDVPQTKTETEVKESEMFDELNAEDDFEIPAFLRRQKN